MAPVRRLPEVPGPLLPTDVVSPLVAVALAGIGALVVLRGDAHRYGWLLLAMGATTSIVGLASEYSVYGHMAGLGAALPFRRTAGWVQDLWMVTWMLGFLLLPAWFPDGRTASPRWRQAVRLAVTGWLALIGVFALAERPLSNAFLDVADPPANPVGVLPVPQLATDLAWLVVTMVSLVIGIGSLVARWRAAEAELRQQVKWVLYAFGTLLVVAIADLANQALEAGLGVDVGLRWPLAALMAATMVGLAVALGLAVLKLRLYAVDLVINRTLVYAVLSSAIVIAYVAVVVGIGAVLPVQDLFLSLVATGIVAVAFTPMRTGVQRWVNRLMFGQRDDPYAVLSELGRLLARSGAPEATLQTLAETVATALRLPGATIDVEQDGVWRTRACHGTAAPGEGPEGFVVPLEHQGEVVGRLVVVPRSPREHLSAQDRRLLEDIAHQAGALVHTVRLTLALQRSREGLVVAREEERRRIRRDLHDGLGPSLASQMFRLDAVREQLHGDPDAARALIDDLKRQNQELVADIRRLVHELRPPALDELGLSAALTAHVGHMGPGGLTIAVETEPDPLPTLPAAVEVAAYRIAREALTNVVRHAQATRCAVVLEMSGATVSVTITDDGIGRATPRAVGVGLTSMRERAEELGGSLTVTGSHPTGTRVRATLPVTAPATALAKGAASLARGMEARHG